MRRESKKGNSRSDAKDIIQQKKTNYPSRYTGNLAPKDKIVDKPVRPSYKSRYK